jgi:hypothetical protein
LRLLDYLTNSESVARANVRKQGSGIRGSNTVLKACHQEYYKVKILNTSLKQYKDHSLKRKCMRCN